MNARPSLLRMGLAGSPRGTLHHLPAVGSTPTSSTAFPQAYQPRCTGEKGASAMWRIARTLETARAEP